MMPFAASAIQAMLFVITDANFYFSGLAFHCCYQSFCLEVPALNAFRRRILNFPQVLELLRRDKMRLSLPH